MRKYLPKFLTTLIVASIVLSAHSAQAALQIKKVYRGSTTFASEEGSQVVAIGGTVDTSKSIILISASSGYNAPGETLFAAVFDDSSNILIKRGLASEYNTGTPIVEWQVVEFADGVTVYSGLTTLSDLTKVVTLPSSLVESRSLVIINRNVSKYFKLGNQSGRQYAARNDECWEVTANITNYGAGSPAQLTLQRNDKMLDNAALVSVDIYYQVIQFDSDVSVQHNTLSIANASTSNTATVTSVDTTKSLLFFSTRAPASTTGAGIESDYSVRGEITNGTTLTFTRATSTGAVDLVWYLLTFSNATAGQKAVATTSTASATGTLSPNVATDRSFSIINVSGASGATTDGLDDITFRQVITTSGITMTRDGGGTTAMSIPYFVAELPAVKLVTPNGGESLEVGSSYNITWRTAASSGGTAINNVKLEYSDDNGGTWKTIIASVAASPASYSWTVGYDSTASAIFPATEIDTDCLVRVSIADAGLTGLNDVSDTNLTMKSRLLLDAPNGGESWNVGNTKDIKWKRWGNFTPLATVVLQYSLDYPTYAEINWNNIATVSYNLGETGGAGNLCTYSWANIPLSAGGQNVKVRVKSSNNASINDISDSPFVIQGNIAVTKPASAEEWPTGYQRNIEWTLNAGATASTTVDIQYSLDNGGTWSNVALAQDADNVQNYNPGPGKGSYAWTPPLNQTSNLAVIKVFITGDTTTYGQVNFKIIPSLRVDSPNAGTEIWRVGDTQNITWTLGGSTANVKIEYSTDGGTTYPPANVIVASTPAAALSYPWTIPDAIGAQVKVKISDVLNPATIYDASDNNFNIKGKLVVSAPNGSNVYIVGSSEVISWQKFGTLGNINIKYSTDGGATYPNLITGTPVAASALNYTWTPIPDTIGTTVKVLLELVSDPSGVFDASDANFLIKGSLTVTAPNGGQTLSVGGSTNITWTKNGSIGNVELRYSTDGGTTFPGTNIIATGLLPTASPYAWTVPDAISSQVRVKVLLISDTSVFDISDSNLAIKGSLTITAPNTGSEKWEVGTSQAITWTRNGASMGTARLDYSKNGGVDGYAYPIATAVASGALTYSWTIPDAIGTQVRVKIAAESDATINDTSDNNFAIIGRFVISAPVGGETWYVGQSNNITWSTYGTIDKVNLYYSTNGGSTYPSSIMPAATNVNGYLWTIPDAIGVQARVKLENYYDSTVFTTSPANFTIKGRVIVTSPNGTEVWKVGEAKNITWTAYGTIGNVEIKYSTDGGTTYPNTIVASVAASAGTYGWTVPDSIGANLKVKITSLLDSSVTDESNAVFEIKGTFALTAPNGTETFYVGDSTNITWTKTGTLGNVELRYSTDGGTTYPAGGLIVTAIAATATPYAWTVPDAIGTQLRVKVLLLSDPTNVFDESNANFTIKGKLLVNAPNGAETWEVGTSQNITWTRTGSIANAELRYSTDGGTTYPAVIIASTSAATGSYSWTIPDAVGSALKVKVTDVSDATVNDVSNANFTIKGKIVVTYPNGAETLIVGTSYNATWNSFGTIPKVNLYYSTDGGTSFPSTITTALTNTNTYSWLVPDIIGTQVQIKVANFDDATNVFDVSNANFTVKGSLAVTSPNGAETWIVGELRNITWTKTGSIGNVKILYSTDGGGTYPDPANVISASTPGDNLTFAWTIPDKIGTNLKVKIISLTYADVLDESNAVFTIKGSLTLTAPDGGEVLVIGGSPLNITWTKTGTVGNAKLEYSTDGGSTYPNIITAAVDTALLTYSWTIPDNPTTQGRVKITSVADSSVNDISNANFRIRGNLNLTAPDGGQNWNIGSQQNITWTVTGAIANAKLDYSTDAGVTYPNVIIASTSASAGSYAWTIPDAPTSQARVRITDTGDSTVTDNSLANFNIKPTVTVVAPNGGEVWTINSVQSITWSMIGTIANVKLEYSTDGGTSYPYVIISSTPAAALSYSWTIPDTISNTCMVKVSSAADSTVNDISNAYFKIRGSLTVTAPNGAEGWPINSNQNITWTKVGSIANVKLEYSTNGFSDELQTYLIAASVNATTGTPYSWLIPDAPSSTVKVRISDVSDSTVYDLSNGAFSVKGSLWITAPNGAETWIVGATNNITWTKFGAIANVELRYSTDGGTTYPVGNIIIASTAASALTYSWTIPDSIGTQLKVKITDTGDGTVTDESNANFTVKGSVTVGAPNGGETWIVGANQNITWTRTGSFINVKLEYSRNGFTDELQTTVITASTLASPLTYAWTVPDAIGTNLKVRISDAADATVTDVSNGTFTIKGALVLTSPNGAEAWIVGESRNITWNRTGSIANAKLEYSTDAGVTYPNVIIASTGAAAGTYAWTVPNSIGNQLRVRVSDVSDATVLDTSDANFTVKGSVTVGAPNGGEAWVVGTSQNITWTKTGTIATVKLEYSTNAFADELQTVVIAASVDAVIGTPYAWTIPDAISSTIRVRITNNADTTVKDISDGNFKIIGSFTLTAPNGTENWTVGNAYNITWTKTGSVANAKLEYSTNGGTTYPNLIVASTPAGGLSYSWTIPDAISATAKVKISDATDATVFDTSNANFNIIGGFTVVAPNGSEVWVINESRNITWTTAGTVANVKLEYSTDGGTTYPNVIIVTTPNTGSFAWTVPDSITTAARVKVSDASNASAFDTSNTNFKIRGSLTVTAPNGTEGWPINTNQNITWTKVGSIASVKLEYSTNGFSDELQTYLIAASVNATTGTPYSWIIPDAPSSTVKVRVSNVSDSTVYDLSNANFSIKGSLTISAPNGAETWIVGATNNITWTKFGAIANVELRYTTDGGTTYPVGNIIIASTPASNLSYSWTIPDAIGTQTRVKITDLGDATVIDESNANFTIKGSVTVGLPNGGETWIVGANQNITWTRTGSFANVKLEYSRNAFADELQTTVITTSTLAAPLTYAWTVPDAIGTNLKVRISDAADATVTDVSNGTFTIKGALALTAPNGAETWIVGESRNITWNRTGSITNAKLEYSVNAGVSYPNVIIASTGAAAGTYAWTVPDSIGNQLRVRVTDVSDATVNDTSDANFTIKSSVTVGAPNGGEAWIVGTSQNITWTKTGTIATVKLEYSTNAFADELQTVVIAASVDAVIGTPYAWTIPDAISSTIRLRITNNADTTVKDISDGNFKIIGSFTLTAPNGTENWTVGNAYNITWTKTGSVANAKLEYSTNGGSTYPNLIVASTPAGGLSYSWTVPDAISSQARVKISDSSDATVFDASNANFNIIGGFSVTAPNGGEVWVVNESRSLTWNTAGTVANVKLEYSTDGGSTYPNVIILTTPNTGSYAWTVPDSITTAARIRVADASNANAMDTSNANFKIRGSVTVTAPNGTEGWPINTNQNITWTKVGSVASVKLEYSTNAFSDELQTYLIAASVNAATGTPYSWLIPDAPSSTVKVRISDVSDSTVYDLSNANFSIKGSLTITAPNGAETWIVGATNNITWTKFGAIANVELRYTTNGGTTYPVGNIIIASTPASNLSYSWTIPDAIGTQTRVKITDLGDATVIDESNANFTIKGSVTVGLPNGGETWIVGANQNITWTRTGSFANVKLEYSRNGFTDELQTTVITASTLASPLTYAWTVPDAIGISLKVRISDAADATVTDVSNGTFAIKGALALTAPNGAETWIVGQSQNITWNRTGSIANVKLEYSTNSGSTYPNVIIASTGAAAGTYGWTIPDAIGSQLRVRVTDVSDATVNDASDANFTVKGSLTMTAPNGGEAWVVGSSHDITWTKTGTFATVKLEYSTNGFADELATVVIVASTDATGTPASSYKYGWTVPDAISSSVKARISNTADAAVTDRSDTNFKIAGAFTLTAPNGTEQWTVGTVQTVSWTRTGSIANAKLEYSTNGGTTYPNIIIGSTPAAGLTYSWTIPDSVSTTSKVRISDAADATIIDISDANFAIRGGFALTAPNGGEVWTVGASQNITWTTTGSVANIKLEYSSDGGTTYPNTIIASTPNAGTYGWTVPDTVSTTLKVRISDVNNANAFDVSNNNFKIQGALAITAPNGAEQWVVGASQNITWTTTGTVANVKLEYSTNGFSDELQTVLIIASTPNTNSYAWTIPDAISSTVKVRITNVSDSTVSDVSNANFTIKGSVALTAPNGAEIWIVGGNQNVTWTRTGSFANVKLEYSSNAFANELQTVVITASTLASSLTYAWTIPDAIGNTLKVRITDVANATVTDVSNANFEIKGSLTLTSPNGTEVWKVGESRNITWTKTGTIANVKLDYSTDAGVSYPNVIIASTDATTGTYAWTVPDAIGNQLRVKITNVSDAAVNDTSNANFEIKGSLTIISPNNGEVWMVAATQPITWSKTGTIANAKLEYSTDGGVTYPNVIIASTPAAAGSYSWTIPDAISSTVRVKITNLADTTVFDASDANFKIAGLITLTSPNSGESWIINSSQNITWTKTGSIASVKLEYSIDGGTTYPNLIAASVNAATGTPYAWTVPDNPSPTCRVKITNTSDSTVFDTSDGNFRIRGALTTTSPNGTESWIVGESRNITWIKQGAIANAKLEYSTDGGTNYPNVIIASTSAASLTYPWTIPDAIGTTLRVKITDVSDATVYDASDANFIIRGSFTIGSPNGAEIWVVGESRNITWAKTGSIANAKLEYSTDGGVTYPNVIIASTDATTGTYAWTVADAIGTSLRVKITNVLDSVVNDSSNANFEIKGSLALIAPNGGETWTVGSSNNITWSRTGSIANAKLDYSTDGGLSYPNVIIASTSAVAGSYAWTIPDVIGTTLRVKITNVADTTVSDTSNANFKISGSFNLSAPNGGEVWIVGAANDITWTKTGSIANAKLEYSIDGGVSYPNVITASIPANLGSYTWTIPDNMSSTVRVKISDVTDATVLDASNSNFKIAGSFILTAPNGAEKWPIGSSQAVTWTKTGSIANAKLEYSTDGGTTYPNVIIATIAAGTLSYSWTVPNNPSTTCKARITDVSDSTVFDTSNANFKIHGTFTLTVPDGGEVWTVNETRNITWTTLGSIANVKLDYSIDGGSTYPNTIAASTANTGSYSWVVPDQIGTTLRVRITDVLDPDAIDASNGNFKVRGAITVVSPNGGEAWIVASSQNITWTKTGSIANVKIEYSTDGGTSYPVGNLIAASVNATTGTPYSWTIPDAISTTVKVKITATTDATVYDESNTSFTIRGGFTVIAPNGAEKWAVGTSQSVTWTTFGTIPNVRLEYSTDGGTTYPNVITASTPNGGSYSWSIPNNVSAICKIKIANAADTGSFDVSDANFKIMGGFNITSPNGGETLVVGASQSITWTTAGTVANVKLEYSTNGGTTYPNVITASTPNTNSYNWVVADAISATVKIRISDASDSDALDTSNGNFNIKAGFTLSAPNGGEAWVVSSVQNITWTTFGTVANVKLEYSTDGGTTYPNIIIGSVANAGTYAWTIPDAITTAAKVRVSDVNDSTANDTSNANFKIQGLLSITAPNGAEKWTVGSIQTITWNRTGSIPFVKLDYATDGGSLYSPIIASTSNTGSYSWTIPNNISTTVKVKVSDTNDATVNDASNANFKIQAGFSLTVPNGGEVWLVGSSQAVAWTTQGTVNFVKLEYSTDGGTTYPNVITTSTSNLGTYSWTVPDNVSGTVRVKVTDTTDAEAFDASNANFRIRATITLTSPNGGQQWLVGNPYNITWNIVGTLANVKLQYSRDGFLTDNQTISAAAPTGASNGSYSWTVPDAISNTVRVRVSDPGDSGAYDDSNADFKITARFTVTVPNGGEKWDVGSIQNITWTSSGTVGNAKIEYSTNGGATYPYSITQTVNSGTYAWTVPDTISAEFKVKISDPADATAYDTSDVNAKIRAQFTISSPNGAEVWTVGESRNITWTNTGTVTNVKLDYSTDSGTTYPNAIVASTANAGTYAWTVPDSISTTVRVRVMSTTDIDAFDASNADFKIRGALTVTAPNGAELWRINQINNITWTRTGSIANVKLEYSTNSGTSYPNVIIASTPAAVLSYAWTIPDTPSPSARVRITDVSDSTVFDASNADFRIQGFFTVDSPNGAEAWITGTVQTINWTWGGTIPFVKISYSKDSGVTFPTIINAAAPNGAGGGGSYSYSWTIPDDLSPTVRVKVEDPNDNTVYDISSADFKIRGQFVLTAPNGGERWVTNEVRAVTWTTTGTIPNVKLEYSKNNFVTPVTIAASVPNTNSYNWTVPDDRSTTVRVRVSDVNDSTVNDASNADFKIDYYTFTWTLRDLLTNEQLTNISYTEKVTGSQTVSRQGAGLTSPVILESPYGFWTTTWSVTGYGDKAQNFVANADQSFTLFMETTVIHIWRAYSDFAYNSAVDRLDVSSWLERDGFVVSGATTVQVDIYDAATLIKTLTSTTPSAAGFFNLSWTAPTGLVSGKVYTTITTITNASGAYFKTPGSFTITASKTLKDLETTINSVLDKPISQVETKLQRLLAGDNADPNVIAAQGGIKGIVEAKLTAQEAIIRTATADMQASFKSVLTSFETRTQSAITLLDTSAKTIDTAGKTLQTTADKYSWRVTVAPNPALTGDKVTIQATGLSGKVPLLDIYSHDNKVIFDDVVMTATTTPGVYSYTFTTDSKFIAGKAYSYVMVESSTSGFVTGSGVVESMSLTTIAGLAAAAPEAERAAKKALESIKAMEATLISGDNINIAMTLKNLKDSVEELPTKIAKEGVSPQILDTVEEISERIKTLAGSEGYDLGQLFEKTLTESPSIKDLRMRTEEINSVIELLQELFESKFGGKDAPVVSTSVEGGSVVFRIFAVNPSKVKPQKVQIKNYLLEEVKPRDIMDLNGLELEYDAEKSLYYVYKNDLELAPGEVRAFRVHVEDIWFVAQSTLTDLRERVSTILTRLDKSEYYAQAKAIADSIFSRLDYIASSQGDDSMSREQHIGLYRENVKTVDAIKEDIMKMEKILVTAGGPPAPEMLAKTNIKANSPTKTMTWIVIFLIVIFVGLLAGVLFFTWYSQTKMSKEELLSARKNAFPAKGSPGGGSPAQKGKEEDKAEVPK